MSDKMWEKALIILLVLGLATAGLIALNRSRVEDSDRVVELVLDYPDAQKLALQEHLPIRAVLERLRQAGVTTLAVGEYNLDDFLQGGSVLAYQGSTLISQTALSGRLREPFASLVASGRLVARATYLLGNEATTYPVFRSAFLARFQEDGVQELQVGGRSLLMVPLNLNVIGGLSITLAPDQVNLAKRTGLLVAPRFGNPSGVTPKMVKAVMASLPPELGSVAIFTGKQILGYPSYLSTTAEELKKRGIDFGLVEFADQDGEEELARLLDYHILRVHSITAGEMAKIQPGVAVAREIRAVRERNIRVLYFRPFLNPAVVDTSGQNGAGSGKALDFNVQYVKLLKEQFGAIGISLGRARPIQPLSSSLGEVLLMALGSAAGGLLLLRRFARIGLKWEGALLAAAVVGTAGLLATGRGLLARQAWALAASVIFPALGVLVARGFVRAKRQAADGTGVRTAAALGLSLVGLAIASVVTTAGIIFIVGLLGETRFMVKIVSFVGVKVTHTAPILLVWLALELAFVRRRRGLETISASVRELVRDTREALARPVTWEQAALVAVLGLVAVFYLLRTGTYTNVPVSGFERSARDFLEQVLVIRPRTKEFLIGHPALVLALCLDLVGSNWPVWMFYLVGTIGQLSMANTFSHIHTPLVISAVRSGLGLLLGAVVAAVIVAILSAAKALRKGAGRAPGDGQAGGDDSRA